MLSWLPIAVAAIGTASFAVATPASHRDNSLCGSNKIKCPEGTVCAASDPACASLKTCPAQCVAKTRYGSCGGKRVTPVNCDANSTCQDDPRINPPTCGLACDRPGICIPNNAPTCGSAGKRCPRGLQCYFGGRKRNCDSGKADKNCGGICL